MLCWEGGRDDRPQFIAPGLFLGSCLAESNLAALRGCGITHVLSVRRPARHECLRRDPTRSAAAPNACRPAPPSPSLPPPSTRRSVWSWCPATRPSSPTCTSPRWTCPRRTCCSILTAPLPLSTRASPRVRRAVGGGGAGRARAGAGAHAGGAAWASRLTARCQGGLLLAAAGLPPQPVCSRLPRATPNDRRPAPRAGGVLVHCLAGVSRSATVVIAYLMWKRGLSLYAARRHVAEVRPWIRPNSGFQRQLQAFEDAGCQLA